MPRDASASARVETDCMYERQARVGAANVAAFLRWRLVGRVVPYAFADRLRASLHPVSRPACRAGRYCSATPRQLCRSAEAVGSDDPCVGSVSEPTSGSEDTRGKSADGGGRRRLGRRELNASRTTRTERLSHTNMRLCRRTGHFRNVCSVELQPRHTISPSCCTTRTHRTLHGVRSSASSCAKVQLGAQHSPRAYLSHRRTL